MGVGQITRRALLVIMVACSPNKRQVGEHCTSDEQCQSQVCVADTCLAPDEDPDRDGLNNAWENLLGSNPFLMDTDGDGKSDSLEAGSNRDTRPDVDGDGLPDVLESAILDADGDCLPDEIDDSSGQATAEALLSLCLSKGVCNSNRSVECNKGQLLCDYTASSYQPIEQWCDGLDNDCDGQTDEGLFWLNIESGYQYLLGQSCQGVGECGQGTVVCSSQSRQPICSVQPGGDPSSQNAQPELCDGLDNDCDGLADEGLSLHGEPDGPPLESPCQPLGVCLPGVVECSAKTGEVVCSTGPGGSQYAGIPELCNGLDDDCDGQTDEGFAMNIGGQEKALGLACGTGICSGGSIVCAHHQLGVACSTDDLQLEEQCNGQDDDCDGETDEGLDPAQAACASQGVCGSEGALLGQCKAGIWVCSPDGLLPGYEAETEVTCDNLDNDCDGLTDESFVWKGPGSDGLGLPVGTTCGIGVCSGGIVTCADGGQSAACSSLVLASAELCDSIDNDCDGETDEGLLWQGLALGAPCEGTGVCGQGTVVCDGTEGTVVCSSNPDGPSSEAQKELCNGLDDDCDGQTDEDWSVAPAVCSGAGVCVTGGKVVDCVEGQPVCDYSNVSSYELKETLCDGLDNDCDGLVDENLAKKPGASWVLEAFGSPPERLDVAAALVPSDPESGEQVVMMAGGASLVAAGQPHIALEDVWFLSESGQWSATSIEQPPGRIGASLVTDAGCNRIIRYGGMDSLGAVHSDVWARGSNGQWTELGTTGKTPQARAYHLAVVDPKSQWMWVFGGQPAGKGKAIAALDLSDCSNEPKWLAGLNDGPGWRGGLHGAFIPKVYQKSEGVGPFIMVFGGELSSGELLADTWLLDVNSGGWTPVKKKTAPPARRGHRTAYLDGHVYLFGGQGKMASVMADLWRFEPDSMEWQPVTTNNKPPARSQPGFVVRDKQIVMLGGNASGQPLNDVWLLSPGEIANWEAVEFGKLPEPRQDAFLAPLHSEKLLVYGGTRNNSVLNDVWVYDVSANSWVFQSADGPKLKHSAHAWRTQDATLFVNGGLDSTTGGSGKVTNTWHSFQNGAWSKVPSADTFPVRIQHAAVWDSTDARILVFGGRSGLKATDASNQLWYFNPDTGASGQLPQVGQWPPGIWGHRLIYDSAGHRLVTVGGIGSLGKVYILDLATMVWSALVVHESLAQNNPVAVMEPQSGHLFLAYQEKDEVKAWVLSLMGSGKVVPYQSMNSKLGASGVGAAYSGTLGSAYFFGGLDHQSNLTNALWRQPFLCD